jgi:hypothetical protein
MQKYIIILGVSLTLNLFAQGFNQIENHNLHNF